MNAQQWRQALGEIVRDFFRTPEMERFYSIKMTPERARIYLRQLALYARQRRNNWPQVAANCPELDVKQHARRNSRTVSLTMAIGFNASTFCGDCPRSPWAIPTLIS